jgi:tetratricopeptide (TPR) repeat protein
LQQINCSAEGIIKLIKIRVAMKTSNSKDPLDKIRSLIAQNRYLHALTAIDRHLITFSRDEEAYLLKAGIFQLLERRKEAVTLYEWIIEMFPRCTDAYAELIEIHSLPPRNEQDDGRIISLCATLQNIAPQKTPYQVMGDAFMNLDNHADALGAFEKAVEQQILNTAANLIILRNPKYNDDIKEMAQNELNENKLHDAYCDKAMALEILGCHIEAINNYDEAIRLNGYRGREYESYEEYRAIGNIYEAIGDENKAKQYLKTAQQLEEADRDQCDLETHGITEHDFNEWFDKYVVLDQEGKIERIRKEDKID